MCEYLNVEDVIFATHATQHGVFVSWKVKHFLQNTRNDSYLQSPVFAFLEERWVLQIGPCNRSIELAVKNRNNVSHCYNEKEYSTSTSTCEFSIYDKYRNHWFSCSSYFDQNRGSRETIMEPEIEFHSRFEDLLSDDAFIIMCGISMKKEITQEFMNVGKRTVLDVSSSTLIDDVFQAYNTRRLSDVTINVGQEKFFAHKFILASRSPVFDAMFTHCMKENTKNEVDISDIEIPVMRDLLFYMYTDKVNVRNYKSVIALFKAADKYEIENLKSSCLDMLKFSMEEDTICEAAVLADDYDIDELKNYVHKYFQRHAKYILSTAQWEKLSSERLQLAANILKSYVLSNEGKVL